MKKQDEDIISALFCRDEKALSLLSARYGRYLHKIAFSVLSNEQDAAECVNDAYLKIWRSVPPDRPENLKAYASTVTRNIAVNRYKERTREKRIPQGMISDISEIEEFLPDSFSVEGEYENSLLQKALSSFVGSLSKRNKYIFICRYYCADPVKTIADTLGISVSEVYRELSEMRKKLKTNLIKEGLWSENGKS